jgi:hypothetical protein
MVDQRWRKDEAWQRFADVRHVSTQGHRCAPALAGEDEEGEAEPEGCSLEHERWWGGSATTVKDGRGELLIARALESGRELESEGERCGGGQGWCSPFIWVGRALWRGGNGRFNGFNTIDDREELRGGLIRGFKAGEGKCLTGITRHETGVVGMAEGDE